MAKRRFEDFEVENAASTLRQAEKINSDPKLKAAAIKYIKKEKKISEKIIKNS